MKTSGYRRKKGKTNWRRWQWNNIAERIKDLGKQTKDAVVLYLAGEEDVDRQIAKERGFKDWNLLAVDTSFGVVKTLRSDKKFAINAPIQDVVRSWKSSVAVDVILADFCGGFGQACALFDAIGYSRCVRPGTVLSVNMCRGQDLSGRGSPLYHGFAHFMRGAKEKHRGYHFMHYAAFKTAVIWMKKVDALKSPSGLHDFVSSASENDLKTVEFFGKSMRPQLYSYRREKGNGFMDSVIMTLPLLPGSGRFANRRTTLRIAATLAHRTMARAENLAKCRANTSRIISEKRISKWPDTSPYRRLVESATATQ